MERRRRTASRGPVHRRFLAPESHVLASQSRVRIPAIASLAAWLLLLPPSPAGAQVQAPSLVEGELRDEDPKAKPAARSGEAVPEPALPPEPLPPPPAVPAPSAAPLFQGVAPGVSIGPEELKKLQRPLQPVGISPSRIDELWQARRKASREQDGPAQPGRRRLAPRRHEGTRHREPPLARHRRGARRGAVAARPGRGRRRGARVHRRRARPRPARAAPRAGAGPHRRRARAAAPRARGGLGRPRRRRARPARGAGAPGRRHRGGPRRPLRRRRRHHRRPLPLPAAHLPPRLPAPAGGPVGHAGSVHRPRARAARTALRLPPGTLRGAPRRVAGGLGLPLDRGSASPSPSRCSRSWPSPPWPGRPPGSPRGRGRWPTTSTRSRRAGRPRSSWPR